MRGRAVDEPIRDAACSANLPCDRVGDTIFRHSLADGAETVFIFVAFRGFAQFSDNQRKRTQSRNEKAGDDDHNYLLSIICAIISRFELFRTNNTVIAPFNPGTTREMSGANRAHVAAEFFRQTLVRPISIDTICQILEQFCQAPNTC